MKKSKNVKIDKDMLLSRTEFANVSEKVNSGALGVTLLRVPIFQPVDRIAKKGELKEPKVFEYRGSQVSVDRDLSQKHLNVLAALLEVRDKKLHSGGKLVINSSLYALSKKLGYKSFESNDPIKNLINDMHKVTLTVTRGKEKLSFHLIDSFKEDLENGGHTFNLSSDFIKFFAYDFAVYLEKEKSTQLVQHKQSAVTAVIRYFVSHSEPLKNGVKLDTITSFYGRDKTRDMKSKFKKKVRENLEFLAKYNITYESETDKMFYLPSDDIATVLRPVSVVSKDVMLIKMYELFTKLNETEVSPKGFDEYKKPFIITDSIIDDDIRITFEDANHEMFEMHSPLKGDKVKALAAIYKAITGLEALDE